MIGGETVDHVHVVPESLDVLAVSQHGSHLSLPVADPVQVALGEEQVVRTNLAGHRKTLKQ